MAGTAEDRDRAGSLPPYRTIARRIGVRLRDVYDHPESEALPTEHVDLLLRLRHKERDRERRAG